MEMKEHTKRLLTDKIYVGLCNIGFVLVSIGLVMLIIANQKLASLTLGLATIFYAGLYAYLLLSIAVIDYHFLKLRKDSK